MLADERYYSFAHQHHAYLARGRYAEQLEAWFRHFRRDQFLILASEHFYADPAGSVRQAAAFLDCPVRSAPLGAMNESGKSAMDPARGAPSPPGLPPKTSGWRGCSAGRRRGRDGPHPLPPLPLRQARGRG